MLARRDIVRYVSTTRTLFGGTFMNLSVHLEDETSVGAHRGAPLLLKRV